jgi:hypothetical protein
MDDAEGEGDSALGGKRLRRLFTHATRRTAAPVPKTPAKAATPKTSGEKPVAARAHQ